MTTNLPAAESEAGIARELVALERHALDGWTKGNPDPDFATMDDTITLFSSIRERRLDGFSAVKEFYEKYRGTALFDSCEIMGPKIQLTGEIAVLTFHFESRSMAGAARYFATLVWQQKKEGWRIIHAHWSKVRTQ